MELISRSFRLKRSSSTLLRSESISTECARIAGYERLSESMRMSDGRDIAYKSRKGRAFGFMSKVFNFRRVKGNGEIGRKNGIPEEKEEKKKKKKKNKRSSWLPDPDRRWPVQGW